MYGLFYCFKNNTVILNKTLLSVSDNIESLKRFYDIYYMQPLYIFKNAWNSSLERKLEKKMIEKNKDTQLFLIIHQVKYVE